MWVGRTPRASHRTHLLLFLERCTKHYPEESTCVALTNVMQILHMTRECYRTALIARSLTERGYL
jgi:hypothetical protein